MWPKHDTPENPGQLEGHYANYFAVGHNALEFLLDFGQDYDEANRPRVHTRIITSPSYVKDFLKLLTDAVADHEKIHGVSEGSNQPKP